MAGPVPSSFSSNTRKMFLKEIRVLAGVVFIGYLIVWILTPTNPWKNDWLLKLRSKTDDYYGVDQGGNLLVYTFPIMLIAVLGCIYLHLISKNALRDSHERDDSKKKDRLGAWRRPIFVKGSLGVVSTIEFSFLLMFMALLVWTLSRDLATSFHNIDLGIVYHHHGNSSTVMVKNWQRKVRSVGFYMGTLGNICTAFLFYPVTRGSSILPQLGLTSEGSIKYHIWLGHLLMFFFTAHGFLFVLYWAITNTMSEMLKWANTGRANIPGELALLFGLAMWITVLPRIRRKKFELFFYTHQLYTLFIVFYILHLGIAYCCMILPGLYLFLIDRYLRFLQSRQRVRLVSTRLLPCQTLELNFAKSHSLTYTPTSVIFINVPSISSMQWHPFTVTSNSSLEPDKLSVVIKTEGSWSQKLYDTLSCQSPVEHLTVSVEGPYGPTSTHHFFSSHEAIIMVTGGSGITPVISIIRELITRKATGRSIPKIKLICAFKHSSDLTMLDLILPVNGSPSELSRIEIEIDAFVTRDKQDPNIVAGENKQMVRTIWFKPDPSDALITPVLGTNGWLWLGIIISTSFILFLIVMGIISKVYIYPIDQNTNEVFSYSTKAVLNMLFICVFIILTASVAFLWTKKTNSIQGKQVQSTEISSPTASPSSWFYDGDRELEGFPQESLAKSIKVHFGNRPDLKRMLLEQEADGSVGVLVSGPTEMRHEVAHICSSGLANNLHYEAISFNW